MRYLYTFKILKNTVFEITEAIIEVDKIKREEEGETKEYP